MLRKIPIHTWVLSNRWHEVNLQHFDRQSHSPPLPAVNLNTPSRNRISPIRTELFDMQMNLTFDLPAAPALRNPIDSHRDDEEGASSNRPSPFNQRQSWICRPSGGPPRGRLCSTKIYIGKPFNSHQHFTQQQETLNVVSLVRVSIHSCPSTLN